MLLGNRILVVDDSRLMLEVLGRVLAPHCAMMLLASSYRDALRELSENPDIGVVICDVDLTDGNGFQLLELLVCESKPMPKFLMFTAHWSEEERERALSLGARAYLRKPVSLREIRSALVMPDSPRPRNPRHCTLANAWIVDPERRERLVCLGIHDISATGALLDSTGPLPVGTKLEFEIVYSEHEEVRAKGTVVRVQEPSWGYVGGVGIAFRSFGEGTKELLTDYVSQALKRSTELTGRSNELILDNLGRVLRIKDPQDVVIRIPVIPGCNDSIENIRESAMFVAELGFTQIELMPYHEFGVSKYRQYGMVYQLDESTRAAEGDLQDLRRLVESFGLQEVTGRM